MSRISSYHKVCTYRQRFKNWLPSIQGRVYQPMIHRSEHSLEFKLAFKLYKWIPRNQNMTKSKIRIILFIYLTLIQKPSCSNKTVRKVYNAKVISPFTVPSFALSSNWFIRGNIKHIQRQINA